MKYLFESWRKYIKETQAPQKLKLLKEFNRKDKESLMDMESKFSVSYEIELESDESFRDDSYGESRYDMDRVRGALNEDYFYEDVAEREAEYGLVADGNSINDYEELARHFLEEEEGISDPQENNTEALYAIIAFEKDPDYYKDFVDLLSSGLSPNAPLNPAMTSALLTLLVRGSLEFRNAPEDKEAEILKNMGLEIFEDTQTNLPFPEGEESPTIYRSGNLAQFVNKYLYNLSSDAPYDVEGFTSFDRRLGICSLLDEFEIEVKKLNSKEFRHDSLGETLLSDAENALEAIMQGGSSSRYPTIRDLIDSNEYNADDHPVSNSIESMVSSLAEQYVEKHAEAQYEEFLEDPVEYLEEMGLDMSEYEAEPEDSDYMTSLYTHLPNFMNEYADQLKFEEDASLDNGVEFSMDNPLYMTGLEEAFNFLELFFTDLDNQTNFRFDSNTGLHTNIGYLSDEDLPEPNLMKGLLLLNDKFARKGFENRGNSRWARDLKAATKEYLGKHTNPDFTQKELMKSLTSGATGPQLKELEKMLTSEVLSAARGVGAKSLGMNVLYIKGSEYVEFRYPGNIDPTYDKMVDATLYYSHIVRSIYDENYKRKSYVKKLFGFISNLGEYSEDTTENVKRLKGIISAGVGTIYSGALRRSEASLAEIEELYADIGEAYSWDSQETFRRVLSHMGPGYSARKRNFPLIYGGLRRVGKSKTKKDYVVVFYRPISSQTGRSSQSIEFKVHTFSIEEMISGKVNDFSLIDGEFIMANKVDKEKRDKAMDMMGLSTDPSHLKNVPSNDEALFKIFSDWKQAFYRWRASNENYIEKRKGVFE